MPGYITWLHHLATSPGYITWLHHLAASARFECVLNPLDRGRRPIRIAHHQHVEARRQRSEIGALLQQLIRRARDALLLAAVDAGRRPAVGVARAHAYLGDNQHAICARDDVELTE